MKKLIVVVAAIVAACSAQKPTTEAPAPNVVTLATFTGEIDTVKGTFTIQTEPTAVGRAVGMQALTVITEPTEVTIENDGSKSPINWSGIVRGAGASNCNSATVTGAWVKVTQVTAVPAFLGGVYAQVLTSTPSGLAACNADPLPAGVTGTYGAWSYGTLMAGSLSGSKEWNFTFVSGQSYAFTGNVVAVKGKQFSTGLALPNLGLQRIAFNGTNMVYIPSSGLRLAFVNLDGSSGGTSESDLPVGAAAIATGSTNDRIWFLTDADQYNYAYVGFILSAGTGPWFHSATASTSANVYYIVVDPTDSTTAYFTQAQNGRILWKAKWDGSRIDQTNIGALTGIPAGITVGSDGNIFVTAQTTISKFSKAGGVNAAPIGNYTIPAGCSGPWGITSGPGPNYDIWFNGNSSNSVCSMTKAGVFTVMGASAYGTGIVVGPDDQVWSVTGHKSPGPLSVTGVNKSMTGATPTYPVYPVVIPDSGTSGIMGIAANPAVSVSGTSYPAALWVPTLNVGVARLQF